MTSDSATADEQIRIAKAYFAKVDAGDTTLLEMFTKDVQAYFPKIGTTHGRSELVTLVQTLTSVVPRFAHDPRRMVFTQQGSRLVVEGIETGEFADGTAWPAGAKSEGRYCNVFEFDGNLIQRLHIHVDPDFAGRYDDLLLAPDQRPQAQLAADSPTPIPSTGETTWHANSKARSPSSPAEPRASDSPQRGASSKKGRGCA